MLLLYLRRGCVFRLFACPDAPVILKGEIDEKQIDHDGADPACTFRIHQGRCNIHDANDRAEDITPRLPAEDADDCREIDREHNDRPDIQRRHNRFDLSEYPEAEKHQYDYGRSAELFFHRLISLFRRETQILCPDHTGRSPEAAPCPAGKFDNLMLRADYLIWKVYVNDIGEGPFEGC